MTEETAGSPKKVGWFCTYTPEEIIHAAGFTPYRVLPQSTSGAGNVEDALPANLCPYPRKILSNIRRGLYKDLHGIVVANSCNAMIHLYNVLKEESDSFVYLLDLPRKQDGKAVDYFTRELELLAGFLGSEGETVTENRLVQTIKTYRHKNDLLQIMISRNGQTSAAGHSPVGLSELAIEAACSAPETFNRKLEGIIAKEQNGYKQNAEGESRTETSCLLLTGGLPPHGLEEILAKRPGFSIYPENCSGMRYLQKPLLPLSPNENPLREELFEMIACNYLEKLPCPRIFNRQAREDYYRRLLDELPVRAVIYHDLLFCDMCHYDYLMLKNLMEEKDIPHLKLKTELGKEDLGQLKTRVEAFLEILE